jgi:hypothetical protein
MFIFVPLWLVSIHLTDSLSAGASLLRSLFIDLPTALISQSETRRPGANRKRYSYIREGKDRVDSSENLLVPDSPLSQSLPLFGLR